VKKATVSLQSGYVLVSGEHQRLNNASKTDSLSFQLDLSVSNSQLTATISNALIDNQPIEQNRVDHWMPAACQNLDKRIRTAHFNPSVSRPTWSR